MRWILNNIDLGTQFNDTLMYVPSSKYEKKLVGDAAGRYETSNHKSKRLDLELSHIIDYHPILYSVGIGVSSGV